MAKRAAEEEAAEAAEVDYTKYADKAPSDLQERFAQWVIDEVGVEFKSKAAEEAFREGVRLATILRMPFQRSPENQEILAERRAAVAEAAAKKTSKGKTVKKPKPVVEDDEDIEEEEQPAPKRKAAKKASATKVAAEEEAAETSRPSRRPARRRAAADAPAPF